MAALEPTPAAKPAEATPPAPVASSAPTPEEPAENEPEPTPPPVTVSEVPDEPVSELNPAPNLSSNLSSSTSGSDGAKPATTEIAALSPTVLPPAATDGSTRYGIAILKTMVLYKLHKKHIWSHKIFRDPVITAPATPARA